MNYKELIDDMTWSFSRLNSFDICPYCWYQNYILKREGQQNAFAEFGTLCHNILEKYFKGEIMLWDMVDEFKNNFYFTILNEFPPNKFTDLKNSYYQQGISYFSNFTGFPNYEVLSVEEEINIKVDKYNFTGFIDLVVRDIEDKKIKIIDHKSKSNFKNKSEQKEYARQLYLYSKAIKEKYGEYPKELIFNMFRKQQIVTIPFNERDYKEAQKWMIERIELIKNSSSFPVIKDEFFGQYLCSFRHDEKHIPGYVLSA